MTFYQWRVWRLAYAPGCVGHQYAPPGEWWQIAGPFYWLAMTFEAPR